METVTLDVTVYDAAAVMPIMDRSAAKVRYQAMVDFVGDIMREGVDFGKVPGTGDKPTLLKPGAEKLTTFFGLSKRFTLVEKIEDWTGKDHGGEAFFYYLYRCLLYRGDLLIAECDGSANSWESKYRYRKAERVCPVCGNAAIIKGKAEYGGGWLCFAKRGGCGAKFKDGDQTIEAQETGRIVNPDPADVVNTLQKMSQKRALVGATLLAVNGSDYFTQDVEDYVDAEYTVVAQPKAQPTPTRPVATNGAQAQAERDAASLAEFEAMPSASDDVWRTWHSRGDAIAWAMEQHGPDGKPLLNGYEGAFLKSWTKLQGELKVSTGEMYEPWYNKIMGKVNGLDTNGDSHPTQTQLDALAASQS